MAARAKGKRMSEKAKALIAAVVGGFAGACFRDNFGEVDVTIASTTTMIGYGEFIIAAVLLGLAGFGVYRALKPA